MGKMMTGYISDEFYKMIPRGETFELLGVFSKAVYFRGSTGSILLIFEDKFGSVPFGIAVTEFRKVRIDEGCEAVLSDDQVRILKDGAEVQKLTLVERKTKRARPGQSLDRLSRKGLAALAVSEKGALKKIILKEAEETVYARKLAQELSVMEKLSGSEQTDEQKGEQTAEQRSIQKRAQLKASLHKVIGLGPGLTPSCDDFFVGFLYAQKYFGMENALLRECIEEVASSQTTASSAAFLQSVCAGRTISVIEDLFAARSEAELDAALALLLGVGSNSGADILTGVLEGMRFCQEHM